MSHFWLIRIRWTPNDAFLLYSWSTHWSSVVTSVTLVSGSANIRPWLRRGHYQRSRCQRGPWGLHYSLTQQACSKDRSGQSPHHPPTVNLCLHLFHHLVFFVFFFLTRAAAAVKEFTGTPWYFPTFWGCFLSVDLQPCRFSALSASELCLWPLAVTVDTEESQLNVSVFVSAGSGRLINPSGKHSFRPNPYAFVPWK